MCSSALVSALHRVWRSPCKATSSSRIREIQSLPRGCDEGWRSLADCARQIFLEFCNGGTLLDANKGSSLSEDVIVSYLNPVLSALAYLDKMGLMHLYAKDSESAPEHIPLET